LWELARVLWRRWYVTILALLVIPLGVVWVLNYVPTQYQASGQLMFLLPPKATGESTPSNPYLNLPPGLTTMASLTATEAMGKEVAAEMLGTRTTAEYSVALVAGAGPLLTITTKDIDPAEAVALRDRVMAWLQARLIEMQEGAGAPLNQMMRGDPTNLDSAAEPLPGNRLRALAGVVAAGIVLLLLIAVNLDRALRRRADRQAVDPAGTGPVPEEPEAEAVELEEPESEEPEAPEEPAETEVAELEEPEEPEPEESEPDSDTGRVVVAFHERQVERQARPGSGRPRTFTASAEDRPTTKPRVTASTRSRKKRR
jgi:hypothetical protein